MALFFYIWANLFNVQIMEDSWILISAPAFGLLQYVVFVEANEENLASLRYVVRKGRGF